jgi:hypothetical protein
LGDRHAFALLAVIAAEFATWSRLGHPGFHAHLVMCDRRALRPGVERGIRPRLLRVRSTEVGVQAGTRCTGSPAPTWCCPGRRGWGSARYETGSRCGRTLFCTGVEARRFCEKGDDSCGKPDSSQAVFLPGDWQRRGPIDVCRNERRRLCFRLPQAQVRPPADEQGQGHIEFHAEQVCAEAVVDSVP